MQTISSDFGHDFSHIASIFVSVVIPVYNGAKYIEQCLNSITSQYLQAAYEVVVVDDCSTDNTFHIVSEYSKKFPIVRLTRHEHNLGQHIARHTGVLAAYGRFVLFIDSDDRLVEGALSKFVVSQHTYDADIVVGGFRKIRFNQNTQNYDNVWTSLRKFTDKDSLLENVMRKKIFPVVWGVLIDKELLVDKLHDVWGKTITRGQRMVVGEDVYTSTRVYFYSKRPVCLNEVAYLYVETEGSLTNNGVNEKMITDNIAMLEDLYEFVTDEHTGLFTKYYDIILDRITSYLDLIFSDFIRREKSIEKRLELYEIAIISIRDKEFYEDCYPILQIKYDWFDYIDENTDIKGLEHYFIHR